MRAYELLLILMIALLASMILAFMLVHDAEAGGLANPSQLARKALAGPPTPANPGQPAPPRISIASTSLDSIAKPLSAVSISLDVAVARGLAKPKKPAQIKSQLASGGHAARPARLLSGVK